jgi:hypothetical protein
MGGERKCWWYCSACMYSGSQSDTSRLERGKKEYKERKRKISKYR